MITRKRDITTWTMFIATCAFVMFYSVSSLGATEGAQIRKEYQHEDQR